MLRARLDGERVQTLLSPNGQASWLIRHVAPLTWGTIALLAVIMLGLTYRSAASRGSAKGSPA